MTDPDARDRERDQARDAVYDDHEPQDEWRYAHLISEPLESCEAGERL